ncbi:Nodulation protein NolG [Durusdinium trenchii]|uniref:Nodulation protein NolG n=1 Tax=Durusdinium trenchii TaxID=1381693 RepID=A0ABP0LL90_9DINO
MLAGAAACSSETDTVTEPPVRPIKLVTVEASSNRFPVSYPAVIEAAQSSVLTFQVNGLLQELPVTEGLPVERGALIAKLDQRDYQNNFNSAKAQYDNAESEYQRARRLFEENAISRSVLEQRRSQRDITKAQFDTAQKALDDTELRAPFSGQIAQINVENFQNVSAQQAIVTLQSTGDVEAVFDMPARVLAYVPQINPVDTTVTLDAAPNVKIPAEFKEATGQADPTTQTYRVRFTFAPPDNLLILPGMTGKVDAVFIYNGDQIDLGVSVPTGSVLAEGDEQYVWILNEDEMTVSKRSVTVSQDRFGEEVAITAGLQGGEIIAGAGASYLQEGMRVRAWENGQQKLCSGNVLTQYPGASPEEVANEVAEPLETALQEMQEVEEIRSTSRSGFSEISVDIKYEFSPSKSDLQLIWTKLRNKVNDAQGSLPPGAGPSVVFDDFGDVYGLYYLLTGEGYSADELLDYAKELRKDLLQVDDVGKVSFGGEQTEVIYVEIARERASALGVSLSNVFTALSTQNAVVSAGTVKLGENRFVIAPSGDIDSVDAIGNLLVTTSSDGAVTYLRDIATVTRGYQDPASMMIRFNGEPSLAIGVSNVTGANVVKMGDAIDAKLAEVEGQRPIGMELHEFYHQGKIVNASVQDFAVNVGMALAIVLGTLLIFMGPRSGLVIGSVLLLTIAATLATMNLTGIPMHRISLGALIIALGMLVDNAIVVTEGILIGVQSGRRKLDIANEVVGKTKWPLLGGTLVGIIAFAPIGFAPGSTAEYTGDLFWVIMISLLYSWVFALTLTPLFCHWLFQEKEAGGTVVQEDGRFAKGFKWFVRRALKFRWIVALGAAGVFCAAIWGFQFVKSGFFPASTTPQIVVDYWLPEGVDITTTDADLRDLEAFVGGLDGVESVQTLVGGGALRYMLVYNFESQNPAYGQILARVDDYNKISTLIPQIQSHIDENYPNAQGKVWRFILGPGGGSKIEATFKGPDPKVLRRLANEAKAIMAADGRALSIKDDWRQPVSVIEPIYSESKGRQLGVSREDFANALQTNFSGRNVGVYREGDKLIPIISRAPEDERVGIENIWEIRTLSSATGRVVPLSQAMDGVRTVWRDAQIRREDRVWTIKAQADPYPDELASDLLSRIRGPIEAIALPQGYTLEWDGEIGSSTEANENLASTIPLGLLAMVLVVVVLFNALRQPLVIWLVVPLSIIGVVIGLVTTGTPMEFMAILGVLSLSGLLIKNAIVLVDQMNLEISEGKPRYDAVVDSAASRVRPVMMGSLTTVLGVLPLFGDAFFRSMAVVLVYGLSFATLLTLVIVPVLYAMMFNIRPTETTAGAAAKANLPETPEAWAMAQEAVGDVEVGLQLNWELDVWGRIRSGQQAAAAGAEAAEADYLFSQYSLAAGVARSYFLAIEAGLQESVAQDTVDALTETTRIVNVQYENGLASSQDLALTKSDLATARDTLTATSGAKRDAVRALEILLGRYPGAELQVRTSLPDAPASPPPGVPSEILERRPDLIAAERNVAAAFNSLDSAKAARLPAISLTSNIGGASGSLSNLLDPANVAWTVAGNLLAPLFDGGARQSQVDVSTAEQKQAVAAYGQAALEAFGEVETNLDQGVVLDNRVDALTEAAKEANEAYRVARLRYNEGETDLIDVLTIQQRVFAAESNLASIRRSLLEQRVNLNLALGGSY